MVPSGWEIKKFSHIMTFRNGLNFTKTDEGEKIKIVGVADFKNYSELNNLNSLSTVSVANQVSDNDLIIDKDLLYVRSNGNKDLIGRCLFFPKVDEKLSFSGFTIRGRVTDESTMPEYIALVSGSELVTQQFRKNGGGTNISNLSQQILNDTTIYLPPLPEQQKIAKILPTWDKAIDTTERLIKNSKQLKKSLMQQLLTGQKRLLDNNDQRFVGDWNDGKLKDFSKIKKGKALSKKNITEGSYPVIAGGKSSPYSHNDFTHENIITISASGAYAGYVAFFDYKIWASDCSVVESTDDSDIKYLYYWLRSQQQRIFNLQSGGAQPHIYPKDLEGMKIKLPSLKEQQKIAAVLTNADKEIELLEQQLTDLRQEKKALMQQLLTGKKRVKLD